MSEQTHASSLSTRGINLAYRVSGIRYSTWRWCALPLSLCTLLALAITSISASDQTSTASQSTPRQRVILSRNLGEITANLSSPYKYIHTVVRLDIDQRSLRDVVQREEFISQKRTSISRGRLDARWRARYSQRSADRLAIDAFVDRQVPRLKDAVLRVLAAHSTTDLKDEQWIVKLRGELRDGLNLAMNLPKPVIVNVGVSSFRVEELAPHRLRDRLLEQRRPTILERAPTESHHSIS
jgi:flagellar basal body-associated protein FliL